MNCHLSQKHKLLETLYVLKTRKWVEIVFIDKMINMTHKYFLLESNVLVVNLWSGLGFRIGLLVFFTNITAWKLK